MDRIQGQLPKETIKRLYELCTLQWGWYDGKEGVPLAGNSYFSLLYLLHYLNDRQVPLPGLSISTDATCIGFTWDSKNVYGELDTNCDNVWICDSNNIEYNFKFKEELDNLVGLLKSII